MAYVVMEDEWWSVLVEMCFPMWFLWSCIRDVLFLDSCDDVERVSSLGYRSAYAHARAFWVASCDRPSLKCSDDLFVSYVAGYNSCPCYVQWNVTVRFRPTQLLSVVVHGGLSLPILVLNSHFPAVIHSWWFWTVAITSNRFLLRFYSSYVAPISLQHPSILCFHNIVTRFLTFRPYHCRWPQTRWKSLYSDVLSWKQWWQITRMLIVVRPLNLLSLLQSLVDFFFVSKVVSHSHIYSFIQGHFHCFYCAFDK